MDEIRQEANVNLLGVTDQQNYGDGEEFLDNEVIGAIGYVQEPAVNVGAGPSGNGQNDTPVLGNSCFKFQHKSNPCNAKYIYKIILITPCGVEKLVFSHYIGESSDREIVADID